MAIFGKEIYDLWFPSTLSYLIKEEKKITVNLRKETTVQNWSTYYEHHVKATNAFKT